MRLVRPYTPPATDSPVSDRLRADRIHRTPDRPQWLREWIEDKGVYVELTCGHRENINDRSTLSLMMKVFGKKQIQVLCERCNDFRRVAKSLRLRDYLGIKTENSDVPLF